jgi:transposase-like protein
MGRGATDTIDRLAASLGALTEVRPQFSAAAMDLSKGGVLLALPALLASGLLHHSSKYFRLPKGFYGLGTIFLLLAFMALARLKSVEALRYHAPGEWGKLLGIDRAPEVRTLRVKLKHLADQEQALSRQRHRACYVEFWTISRTAGGPYELDRNAWIRSRRIEQSLDIVSQSTDHLGTPRAGHLA